MSHALYLAWAYLRFHKVMSAVLVLALALIVVVPLATRMLLTASERQLTARAEATPLVLGARGSALDLIMNGLYFTDDRPETVSMASSEEIWDSGLAAAIPVHVRFEAQGAPIVGTTLDYFDFRHLEIAQGRQLAVLGEAVLGAQAARHLGLGPGDTLISSPENLFDLAGTYPLKMAVVGVLAPTGSPDDRAVFVDLKTAWVIEGLGHGHAEVAAGEAPEAVIERRDDNVVAGAALTEFTEITAENIDSFHFHGDPSSYPLSLVIAAPDDARSATILQGRYLDPEQPLQILEPAAVIAELLDTIFRIGRVLDLVVLIVALAALIAIALAVYLSLQLRRPEIETIFKLGCRRLTIARLMAAEAGIVLTISFALVAATLWLLSFAADDVAVRLLASTP